MKKIGEYTTRGTVAHNTIDRVILFDGRFDTGYRVISFVLLPSDADDVNADVYGTLATEEAAAVRTWNLGDQRQIGWSGNKVDPLASTLQAGIIDPDNFIVEDLFVFGASGNSTEINYMITLEKYDTTDWVGALAMVRNSAQDV
jgi:hypothetical protein